jgi:hypothetical protein
MEGAARRFWLTVVPLLVGFSAGGLLVFAALFPDQLFPVESEAYVATAAVALVSLGILVWQLATPSGNASQSLDRPGR